MLLLITYIYILTLDYQTPIGWQLTRLINIFTFDATFFLSCNSHVSRNIGVCMMNRNGSVPVTGTFFKNFLHDTTEYRYFFRAREVCVWGRNVLVLRPWLLLKRSFTFISYFISIEIALVVDMSDIHFNLN